MMGKKTLTFLLMDAPFENARTTTALRLIDIAARRGYDINVFAYEGAVYLPLAAQLQALGLETVEDATFPPPDPALAGDFVSGRLLRDATRLLFRTGAGPFRSLGRIDVRPRPYQIVPLLKAFELDEPRAEAARR